MGRMAEPATHPRMDGHVTTMLRSIEHPGGKVGVHYRAGDLEVVVVEVDGGQTLTDSTLWGRSSWHLVLQGQALFRAGSARWELLPEESLSLDSGTPYSITNPTPERLRVLSLVRGAGAIETDGRL